MDGQIERLYGPDFHAFLLAHRGPGVYTFKEIADLILAKDSSAPSRSISAAFRAMPDGGIVVGADGTMTMAAGPMDRHSWSDSEAYQKAIQNFARNGGDAGKGRAILDSEMSSLSGEDDLEEISEALAFHGFSSPQEADRLAMEILTGEHKKMIQKECKKEEDLAKSLPTRWLRAFDLSPGAEIVHTMGNRQVTNVVSSVAHLDGGDVIVRLNDDTASMRLSGEDRVLLAGDPSESPGGVDDDAADFSPC